MTEFRKILEIIKPPYEIDCVYTPYGSFYNGEWRDGAFSVDYLQQRYGNCDTAAEMKAISQSEAYDLFFDWLAEQGKIPAT